MFSNSRYLPADIDVDDNSAATVGVTETSFLVEAVKANAAATTASGMPVHAVTAASFQHALQQGKGDDSSGDLKSDTGMFNSSNVDGLVPTKTTQENIAKVIQLAENGTNVLLEGKSHIHYAGSDISTYTAFACCHV
jgi:hypothetical protein